MLNESSAESRSFLHYFNAAISNHLSEKPKVCLVLYGRLLKQLYAIRISRRYRAVWLFIAYFVVNFDIDETTQAEIGGPIAQFGKRRTLYS